MNSRNVYEAEYVSDDLDVHMVDAPTSFENEEYQFQPNDRSYQPGNARIVDVDDEFDYTVQDEYSDEEEVLLDPGLFEFSGDIDEALWGESRSHRKAKRARRDKFVNHRSSWIDDE
jgi:hypothetical protein